MINYKKWILWSAVGICTCFLAGFLYEEITGDFRLTNITFEMTYNSEWEIAKLDPQKQQQLDRILDQRFTYLGKGHQTFVFSSEDGEYVLKFFRFKRLKPSKMMDVLSYVPVIGKYSDNWEKKRKSRLKKLFEGYRVAYAYDPVYTGIVFIHLNLTDNLKKQVKVVDRLGIERTIDLDTVVFAVQKRARMTKDVLVDLLKKGDLESVKTHLRSLYEMYHSEYKQGIVDQDRNILSNTGFVGESPIRLDIGQLKKDDGIKNPIAYKEDWDKIYDKRIVEWLRKHYPSEADSILP